MCVPVHGPEGQAQDRQELERELKGVVENKKKTEVKQQLMRDRIQRHQAVSHCSISF